jgi:hypothetical protein
VSNGDLRKVPVIIAVGDILDEYRMDGFLAVRELI